MRYVHLGRTGLKVSEICLGTMSFGDHWGFGATAGESRRIFDLYVERGGNFLDTANKYHEGQTEEIVGDLLAGHRDRFVLATKYTLSMQQGDPNASGNGRKNLYRSLGDSLRRLKTDYVDLLWIHAWDGVTPMEETMRGLDDLVRAGHVRYVGFSDAPAWVVSHAHTLAEQNGWTSFAGIQVRWSLIDRDAERDLVPMARYFGISIAAWAPLAAGLLSGKYTRGNGAPPEDSKRSKHQMKRLTDQNRAIANAVDRIADELGKTSAQVALAWVRGQGTDVVPIVGARKLSQIEDSLGSVGLVLSPEHRATLDAASAIDLGFPHTFLAEESIRQLVHGGLYGRVDGPR